jgi:3-methyl-2-oxobutanoate hydroxymethyltransferase
MDSVQWLVATSFPAASTGREQESHMMCARQREDDPAGRRSQVSVPDLAAKKSRGEPIVMVTAQDFVSAQVAESSGVDVVLVGDTAAMTMLGYAGTERVSFEEMLMLGRAVRRGLRTPIMVGDMPMGAYEASDELAVRSAQRLIKETGCDVVKLEGAGTSVERARAIARAGIGVMGHLGLTPQTRTALGGFRTQGKTGDAAERIVRGAEELQRAGCFALVLEAIPAEVATLITRRLKIPVIGIGAGAQTDGQVLVFNDLLGIFDAFKPKFVKRYAALAPAMSGALAQYASDVRARRYPAGEHTYDIPAGELERFRETLSQPTA